MNRTAIAARPASYSKSGSTFRTAGRNTAAARARLGGKSFIHFLECRAMPNGLVREHVSESGPADIVNGLRHLGFGEPFGVHIANGDVIEASNDVERRFVKMICPSVLDSGMDIGGLLSLAGALSDSQLSSVLGDMARIGDDFTIAECRQILQPQIDADAGLNLTTGNVGNFYADVKEPIPARIASKAGAVFDLRAGGQRPTFEDIKFPAMEVKSGRRFSDVSPSDGNPAKRLAAPPSKQWALVLRSRLHVLLTDVVNSARGQTEFSATADRQGYQVESCWPLLAPFERMLLRISTEIPNKIDRARLLIQKAVQRLDAVTIG